MIVCTEGDDYNGRQRKEGWQIVNEKIENKKFKRNQDGKRLESQKKKKLGILQRLEKNPNPLDAANFFSLFVF